MHPSSRILSIPGHVRRAVLSAGAAAWPRDDDADDAYDGGGPASRARKVAGGLMFAFAVAAIAYANASLYLSDTIVDPGAF